MFNENNKDVCDGAGRGGRLGRGSRPVRSRKAVVAALAVAAAIMAFAMLANAAAAPGSTADPIALKSYVDSKLEALEIKLGAMIEDTRGAGGAGGAGSGGGAGGNVGGADAAALAARIDELSAAVDRLREENSALRQNIRRLSDAAGIDPVEIADVPGAGGMDGAGGVDGRDGGNGAAPRYAEHFTAVEVYANQRIIFGAGAEMVLRTGGAQAIRGEQGALVDLISGRDFEAGENIPMNHLILSPRDDNRGARISEDAWILIKGPYEIR